MAIKIKLRRDLAANWLEKNPVLDFGEPGYETDTGRMKIGDGTTVWNLLDYFSTNSSSSSGSIGYTGSSGSIGYTGSSGSIGYTGSSSAIDLTGYALITDIPDVSAFITAEDIPAIPADISDLTDTTNLLGGSIDSEPTQLLFDSDGVEHNAGFNNDGDAAFQIRLNSHLSGEEQVKWGFDTNSTLTLPAGGTIVEGIVTDNPTIELTPANPEVESQKLVIKGGVAGFSNTENGITITTYNLTVASGDTATFDVYAPTYVGETFYWWVDLYSPGGQFTPDNGEITLDEGGFGQFSFTVNDDTVPLRIYVADTLYDAYINNKGAVSVTVNDPEANGNLDLYHLHLTTGDLQETSVFLGTDEHNVRTKIDGSVELTSADYDNQNTYRLNFKNNVLKISSTAEPGAEDLYIKAEDDLYLDALGDDVIIRADDDIRLRTNYNFEEGSYNWELRFTDSGEQIIYNDQDGFDYGRITPNLFDEGVRGLTLQGTDQVRLSVATTSNELIFDSNGNLSTTGDIILFAGGEAGRIVPSVSDGVGLQISAELDFEIKVNNGQGSSNIWSFAGNDITFPDSSIQSTAWTGSAAIIWTISASGSSDYIFSGPGIVSGNTNDPVLYLYRGFTYTFINTTGSAHPFAIRVSNGGANYTAGVTGSQSGTQTFTVPMNAPATLYYQCTIHSSMGNVINIV